MEQGAPQVVAGAACMRGPGREGEVHTNGNVDHTLCDEATFNVELKTVSDALTGSLIFPFSFSSFSFSFFTLAFLAFAFAFFAFSFSFAFAFFALAFFALAFFAFAFFAFALSFDVGLHKEGAAAQREGGDDEEGSGSADHHGGVPGASGACRNASGGLWAAARRSGLWSAQRRAAISWSNALTLSASSLSLLPRFAWPSTNFLTSATLSSASIFATCFA